MKKLGFKTYVIHGLAVWHEPFYLKRSIWPMYYAIRNFTLINCVHFQTPASFYIPAVARMFIQFLLRYDYGHAAAIERGLADFLKGPSLLLNAGEDTHKSVTGYLAPFASELFNATEARDVKVAKLPNARLLKQIVRSLTLSGHLLPVDSSRTAQLFDENYVSWKWLQQDTYAQIHSKVGSCQIFRKNPRLFWSLLRRMTLTLTRAVFTFNSVCRLYRQEFNSLSSEPSWRTYLGMPKAKDT